MKVFEVNIYIETSIKAPKAGKAAGMWLIEFITSSDIPVTRSGMITERNTTENALVLKLLTEAFRKLTKTCLVSVNTECGHVLSVVNNGWLPGWEIGGWINKKGRPVANRELWQELSTLMKRHSVEFRSGWHAYKLVMDAQVEKAREGMDGKA